MKIENASSLRDILQDVDSTTMETFDFKCTSKGRSMDVRLKNNSGRPEVVVVKKNEQKVVVCDILCLHR